LAFSIHLVTLEKNYGGDWSLMNGAAGGPSIVRIPGGLGMLSPMRTNARPLTVTPVLANGPITSG